MFSEKEIYSMLINKLLAVQNRDDGLYVLLDFIKHNTPARRMICYLADRERMIMNVLIDFAEAADTTEFSAEFLRVAPWANVERSYHRPEENFVIINKYDRDRLRVGELRDVFFPTAATLAINLHIDKNKRYSLTLLLASEVTGAFTEKDRQFLLPLLPFLRKMTEPYFTAMPGLSLHLRADGPLPHSAEARLRACPGLKHCMRYINALAPTGVTVLLQGETGVGKELAADVLHALSKRSKMPFVKVNCGAIPESLLESELFGHEKGAFTGASVTRRGYFEQADGGTIFLDEVGELSRDAQVRLLRVLENREIQRIGASRTIRLNIRIIAATNRNLEQQAREGTFREDLLYRLSVFPITLPPLRDRPQDVPVLAEYFYKSIVRELELSDPPALLHTTVRGLASLPWPGNVRQLRHTIERAILRCMALGKTEIDFEELSGNGEQTTLYSSKRKRARPPQTGKEEILSAMKESAGRIQGEDGAAARLKLHPATLRARMRALGIPLPRERRSTEKIS